jgi:hypothetical protein
MKPVVDIVYSSAGDCAPHEGGALISGDCRQAGGSSRRLIRWRRRSRCVHRNDRIEVGRAVGQTSICVACSCEAAGDGCRRFTADGCSAIEAVRRRKRACRPR